MKNNFLNEVIAKYESETILMKENGLLDDYLYIPNQRLIIESFDLIIKFVGLDAPLKYFDADDKTKNYFKNAYEDIYKSKKGFNNGKVNIKNSIKILKWFFGESENFEKLNKMITSLSNARNKIAHTALRKYTNFSFLIETKKSLEKIVELINKILKIK